VQVARSTEPEHEALDKLLAGLLVGGLAGLVLAGAGGWWLAGKSLRPVQVAFGRQHAFVSDASHELRTPLAVIRANAEYLQQEQPDNSEVRDIVSETDRLSSLVDALLAVARDDEGARASYMPVNLAEVVEAAVAAFRPLASEHGLELTHATPQQLIVLGDRDQLRQVLVIMLDNAVRYTPSGGRVHVQARPAGKDAVLTVHDTGIGIPEPARLDPLCGAAGLAVCLRGLGLPYDRPRVVAACRPTGEGSSLRDLVDACPKLGASGRPVTADDRGLKALPKPLVVHVEHDHFIAVVRADARGVGYVCSDCGCWPGGCRPGRPSWSSAGQGA